MNKYQKFEQEISKYKKPFKKESFEIIKRFIDPQKSLLDIGCASGDFVFSLDDNIKAVGIDKSSELITLANKKNKSNTKSFFQIDILSSKQNKQFNELLNASETVTILGTFHVFLDFRPLLDKVLKNKNIKKIIIHSSFNDDDIDVRVFHKDLTSDSEEFQSAYNFFSKKTIRTYLQDKGITDFTFVPFEMKKVLKRNPKHPSWNWHLFTKDNEKFLTNGLKLLFNEDILIINK
jgi:hypothetical protein